MNWTALIPIIAQYGIPLAESLFQKWTTAAVPTQADFDELRALASRTAKDEMLLALQRANVDPNSDAGKALLALT